MPEITHTVTETLTEAQIRTMAEKDETEFAGPTMPAYIAACRQWVAEHPEYPDGTIAVAEINDGGDDEIIQRIDGRWCYAGPRAGDYPLGDSDWIEIHGVIHTPPTVRDHLNAIGFTDEQITDGVVRDIAMGRLP